MKPKPDFLLHHIISEIKKGNSPSQISKELKISKQKLQYHLGKLKKQGTIEKVSYGVWVVKKEVKKTTKASQAKREIRGHGFNWRIKLLRKYDWIKHLNKSGIKYKMIGINSSTPRIIFRNKKIWLTQNGMVIYEPTSFFEKDGINAKKSAVFELKHTIEMLGRKMNINFDGQWGFTTSREHYGMIKNSLAKQYNDKGEKMYIKDDKGIWLWVDDSHSLNELETNEPMMSKKVQDWYNDHKKHKFEVNSTYTLKAINGIMQNQVMFDKNFQSHLVAIQKLTEGVTMMGGMIKDLKTLIDNNLKKK